MAGGAAGLYTVVTMPEARGLGIGRAMTLTALLAGREAGMLIGALQATEMGRRIYARLGFEELFRYKLLTRPRAARRR
jgi:predicted acetyltransferase